MTAHRPRIGKTVMQTMQALGRDGATVILASVKAKTNFTELQITSVTAQMVKQGFLAQVFYQDKTDKSVLRPGQWTLTETGRQCDIKTLTRSPRKPVGRQHSQHSTPSLREQFWNLLRCKEKLSIPEALDVLLTPGDDVKLASRNLQSYINCLTKGGYIALLSARIPGTKPRSNGHRRWLLIDDTGRHPPTMSAKKGGIYDRNTRSMRP